MGDVAMSVPVLRAFTSQFPNVKVTFLSRLFFKPMFEDIPNVNFYPVDVYGKHKGVLGLYKLSKELKKLNIDAVADIHNILRSKILRFFLSLFGIQIKFIDKGRNEKKALTRIENKIFKQLKSTHVRYTDVFEKLGFNIVLKNPNFPKNNAIPVEVEKIIGSDYNKLIGVAPFAQHESKMYPLELLEKLILELSNHEKYQILLFGGGEKEIEILQLFEKKFKNTISLAGKIKLKDELTVISNLDCMVCMDSANAHLAAMQGVKTITLWGITHPYAGFYPYDQPMQYALLPDLKKFPNIPCSVYGNIVCKGYEDVMQTILPSQIFEKIKEIT